MDPLCRHCEKRPRADRLGLCAACAARPGVRRVYARTCRLSPARQERLQELARRVRQRLPLFDEPTT